MYEHELRRRAAEADRLLREPLLIEALNLILADARNELGDVSGGQIARMAREGRRGACASRCLAGRYSCWSSRRSRTDR